MIIMSDAASLPLLISSITRAAKWAGRDDQAHEITDDLPWSAEAGVRCAALPDDGFALNLLAPRGSGCARVERVSSTLVLLAEPVPDSNALIETPQFERWLKSGARVRMARVGTVSTSDEGLALMPAMRSGKSISRDRKRFTKSLSHQKVELFGGGGVLIELSPGTWSIWVEPIDWNEMPALGRRARLVREREI